MLIIACGALANDLVRVKTLNQWDFMDFQCLPAELHNRPEKIAPAVREKIRENRAAYKTIFIGYSDCGSGGGLDRVIQEEQVERLPGAHCYEMFAGAQVFHQLHEAELGTFYLTDFLSLNFDRLVIEGLGLMRFPELKEQMFGSYKKLVYLAQRQDEKLEQKARDAAKYLGLDYHKVQTGDTHLQSALSVAIGSRKPAH